MADVVIRLYEGFARVLQCHRKLLLLFMVATFLAGVHGSGFSRPCKPTKAVVAAVVCVGIAPPKAESGLVLMAFRV